jgi:hypothetical protein
MMRIMTSLMTAATVRAYRSRGWGAPIENQPCPVAVLNVGGMDDHIQE